MTPIHISPAASGARIVAGISLGIASRPSTMSIVAVTGAPKDPAFDCVAIYAFKPSSPFAAIADQVALDLSLVHLRAAFPTLRSPAFDSATPSLVVDATLVGRTTFSEFARVFESGALKLDEFVAVTLTTGGVIARPESAMGAEWYRHCPVNELADAALKPFANRRFRVLPSVDGHVARRLENQLRTYRGRFATANDVLLDTTEMADMDLFLSVAAAIWLGSQEPAPAPAYSFGRSRPERVLDPPPDSPRRLNMSRHYVAAPPSCVCGFEYAGDLNLLWACPRCKRDRLTQGSGCQ